MKKIMGNLLKILIVLFVFSYPNVNAEESINMKEAFEIKAEIDLGAMKNVAYNGKIYIGFTDKYKMLKSVDGVNWTEEDIYYIGIPKKVIWDGKQFILLHGDGIAKSENGTKWKKYKIKEGDYDGLFFYDIVYNGDKYVVLGHDMNTYKLALYYSYDCEKWEKSEIKDAVTCGFGERPLYTTAWNGKEFIAIGNAGAAAKSCDGKQWVGFSSKTNLEAKEIIWNGNQFIAVGCIPFSLSGIDENCNVGAVFTSEDGTNWTKSFSKKHTEFVDIELNENNYIVLGYRDNLDENETFDFSSGLLMSSSNEMITYDKGAVLTSCDGVKWNYSEAKIQFIKAIPYYKGFLISDCKFIEKEDYKSCKFFYVDSLGGEFPSEVIHEENTDLKTSNNNSTLKNDTTPSDMNGETLRTDIPLDKEWTLNFNTLIEDNTVNYDNVYILDSNNEKIKAEVYLTDIQSTIKIKPLELYNPSSTYTLVVTSDLKSILGKKLKNDFKMQFMTIDVEKTK